MGVMCMRTLFLTSVAALFLATGTAPSAYAEEPQLGLFWLKDDPSGHWENQRQDCSLIWIAKTKRTVLSWASRRYSNCKKRYPVSNNAKHGTSAWRTATKAK